MNIRTQEQQLHFFRHALLVRTDYLVQLARPGRAGLVPFVTTSETHDGEVV